MNFLERVKENIRGTKQQIHDFDIRATALSEGVYGIRLNPNEHRRHTTFTVQRVTLIDNASQLSWAVKEIADMFRSSLDSVVRELILRNDKTPGPEVCFPILNSTDQFRSTAFIGNIAPNVKTVIENSQPYHVTATSDQSPLWMLQQINEASKNTIALVFIPASICGTADGECFSHTLIWDSAKTEDSAEFRLPFREPKMEVDAKITCAIAFKEICGHQPVIEVLRRCERCVEFTLSSFREFF